MTYFNQTEDINIIKNNKRIVFAHSSAIAKPDEHKIHINSYYEIYIYISGNAGYIVDSSYYNLTKGDIIIINPYSAHKVVLRDVCEYERFYFLINTDAFQHYGINPMKYINEKTFKQRCLIDLAENKEKGLDILYNISQLSTSGNAGTKFIQYGLFLEFLGLINNALAHQKGNNNENNFEKSNISELVIDIMEYIEVNFGDINSTSQIAKHFNISLPYMSTLFSKNTGTTLSSYIQTKKVAHAKELLSAGNTVTDTCFDCGFSDCSYFIKIFKKHTGQTPHQFKTFSNSTKKAKLPV